MASLIHFHFSYREPPLPSSAPIFCLSFLLLFQLRFQHALAHWHFMQQQLGGLNQRIGMEPPLHNMTVKQIEQRQKRHALVVRHPFANKNSFARGNDIIRGLLETECADPTARRHAPQVVHRRRGFDPQRKKGGVRRNHRAGLGFNPKSDLRHSVSMVAIVA